MKKIKEILKNLGLENKEAQIYLTLLKKGELTALQISRTTGLERTSIYDILAKLGEKGITATIQKNNTKTFKAIEPKELLLLFQEKYTSLEKILPKLNKLQQTKTENTTCEFFTGKESLKTVLRNLIESKQNYFAIGLKQEYEDLLGYFINQGILKVNENKAKETVLVEEGTKFTKTKNGKYKFISKELSSNTTSIIYENTVIFLLWTQPYFAIRIKNKDLAKAQKNYFDLLWKTANTKPQKIRATR